MIIVGRCLGYLAIVVSIVIFFLEEKHNMGVLELIDEVLWIGYYSLRSFRFLACLAVVSLIRQIIVLMRGKKGWADKPLCAVCVMVGAFSVLLSSIWIPNLVPPTINGYALALLPVIGVCLITLAIYSQGHLKKSVILLFGYAFYGTYTYLVGSRVSTINSVILFTITLVGLILYSVKNREIKND